jgi:hypothetical protein
MKVKFPYLGDAGAAAYLIPLLQRTASSHGFNLKDSLECVDRKLKWRLPLIFKNYVHSPCYVDLRKTYKVMKSNNPSHVGEVQGCFFNKDDAIRAIHHNIALRHALSDPSLILDVEEIALALNINIDKLIIALQEQDPERVCDELGDVYYTAHLRTFASKLSPLVGEGLVKVQVL